MHSALVENSPRSARAPWLISLVFLVPGTCWLGYLGAYANVPGAPGGALAQWAPDSSIPMDAERPTLLMFIHPQCPCSRASLEELARILAQARELASVYAVFVGTPEAPPDLASSVTWRQSARIPGVERLVDEHGAEARRFGATTSGHVFLFNKSGALLFDGGITGSRGHAGANIGSEAVYSWLTRDVARHAHSFVFGCPLFRVTASGAEELP